MTPEQAAALRAPFPPEAIGKLPRITCPACRDSKSKNCDKHQKHKCAECGNYISTQHLHLDYVGHAGTTDRLLQVDPEWTWEPVALGPFGQPVATDGGLWIRLTVGGVTRYGWGDGPDMKQMISDAIRNAAMRFGVALDLWSKEDLHASNEGSGAETTVQVASGVSRGPASDERSAPDSFKNRRQALKARCVALTADGVSVADERETRGLPIVDSCDDLQLQAFETMVGELEQELAAPFAGASK